MDDIEINVHVVHTKRYGLLRRPTYSSCKGHRLLFKAFLGQNVLLWWVLVIQAHLKWLVTLGHLCGSHCIALTLRLPKKVSLTVKDWQLNNSSRTSRNICSSISSNRTILCLLEDLQNNPDWISTISKRMSIFDYCFIFLNRGQFSAELQMYSVIKCGLTNPIAGGHALTRTALNCLLFSRLGQSQGLLYKHRRN